LASIERPDKPARAHLRTMNLALVILRHGKAEKHAPTGRDADRPLKPRGIRQADYIATQLDKRGPRPKLIVSSPAVRALNTAQIVHRHLGVPLEVDNRLFTDGSVATHMDVIQEHAGAGTLMIVGHTSTLSELAFALLGPGQQFEQELRTGEAIALRLCPPKFKGTIAPAIAKLEARLRMVDEEDD
jgi:phosphohistidine phosphatase